MNIAKSFVFPEIDAAWQKDWLEQIEVIKLSGRMLGLALDWPSVWLGNWSQCDVRRTVSVIYTAMKTLISVRVLHVKAWNYLNAINNSVSFCACSFYVLKVRFHSIKTILKPNGNCGIYISIRMFWQKLLRVETFAILLPFLWKFLPQVYDTFLRRILHLPGRQKLTLCDLS